MKTLEYLGQDLLLAAIVLGLLAFVVYLRTAPCSCGHRCPARSAAKQPVERIQP